jgi:uncharacterized membrane protein (DUF485 family)
MMSPKTLGAFGANVKTSTRFTIFLALIVVYVGLIQLTGAKFRWLSSRYTGTGIDIYIVADYLACFCSGPSSDRWTRIRFAGPLPSSAV